MPSDTNPNYPQTGFYFKPEIIGEADNNYAAFQEVSGISTEIQTEDISEGGQNIFVHKLPGPVKYKNLILRRGIVTIGSALADWCMKSMNFNLSSPIVTKDINVALLDANGNRLMSWSFFRAYLVKCSVSDLKSQENMLIIEAVEFAYSHFTRNDI